MIMAISQPQNLLTKPFANDGNYQIIPDSGASDGRATLSLGFPVETQRPLAQGGIAPNRLDVNGILHMLSAAMFWQQSGGQWTYLPTLNYAVPCIVFHSDALWWCVKENGPDSTIVTPGTSEAHWLNFLDFILNSGGGGKSSLGNPIGTIIAFYNNVAPDGYFACDGSTFSATTYPELHAILGTTILPDLRGEFLRGIDNGRGMDPDGDTRHVGEGQMDAIQNITGHFNVPPNMLGSSGAFTQGATQASPTFRGSANWGRTPTYFNAANVVRTSVETRPHNMAVLFCIKHD